MDGKQKTAKHRIGVISDTHGLVRPELLEALSGVEMIIHAGDVGGGSGPRGAASPSPCGGGAGKHGRRGVGTRVARSRGDRDRSFSALRPSRCPRNRPGPCRGRLSGRNQRPLPSSVAVSAQGGALPESRECRAEEVQASGLGRHPVSGGGITGGGVDRVEGLTCGEGIEAFSPILIEQIHRCLRATRHFPYGALSGGVDGHDNVEGAAHSRDALRPYPAAMKREDFSAD